MHKYIVMNCLTVQNHHIMITMHDLGNYMYHYFNPEPCKQNIAC